MHQKDLPSLRDGSRVFTRKRRGYVVIATAISVFVLIGMLGLAVDMGRLYIYKSEAQAFADSAAIAAATKLDGKKSGLDAAEAVVATSVNRFNFNTQAIPAAALTVEFAQSRLGPWEQQPINNAKGVWIRPFPRPPVSPALIFASR